MKKTLIVIVAVVFSAWYVASQKNISFLSQTTYVSELNDVWGYVDSQGNEYALVGTKDSVSIVNVSNPSSPFKVISFEGPYSTWRDLKTWNGHLYVTNETSNGVFIVDLSNLPGTISFSDTAWYNKNGLESAHNLFIDENGFAYLFGANLGNGGAVILDLSDPKNPVEVGQYNDYYLHDGMVRGDTLWGGAIYDGTLQVIDVSTKSNPVLKATHSTPHSFTHNCWISDDNNSLFTTDEVEGAYIAAYDVSDINNITELDRIQSSPGTKVIPHNTHVIGDFLVTSYYKDGVTIVDASHADNLVEVGFYDTYTGDGSGYDGAWGAYPWLPSGNILVSDMSNGLFVLAPMYVYGCYLEGTVTNKSTGNPISGVSVQIVGEDDDESTDIIGGYKAGVADSGTYSVIFSKAGYVSDTVDNTLLTNGNITQLDIELVENITYGISILILDSATGNAISDANMIVYNNDFEYSGTTDSNGYFINSAVYKDEYEIVVGKWGYVTTCTSQNEVDTLSQNFTIYLNPGYYDDFTFDFGWSVISTATSGSWERDEPEGTTFGSALSNPDEDYDSDCSTKCYVTGNGGGSAGSDDVDDGITTLYAPVFDLSTYTDPTISFATWFFNAGGSSNADDTLFVKLSDGSSVETVRQITAANSMSAWVSYSFYVSDYFTSTSSLQLIVEVSDKSSSGHIVEAGFDYFSVSDTPLTDIPVKNNNLMLVNVFPNPFSDQLELSYNFNELEGETEILITDIMGKETFRKVFYNKSGSIIVNADWPSGVYLVKVFNKMETKFVTKVLKI